MLGGGGGGAFSCLNLMCQAFVDSLWEALPLGGVDRGGLGRQEQGVGMEGMVGRIAVVGMYNE